MQKAANGLLTGPSTQLAPSQGGEYTPNAEYGESGKGHCDTFYEKKGAIAAYENYVREGIERGRRPELVGGGLIRSLGGAQVLSLRRIGEGMASDERILGSGDFIEQVLSEAEEKAKQMLGWKGMVADLQTLLSRQWGVLKIYTAKGSGRVRPQQSPYRFPPMIF
jgi:hypothetical protein